jgi:hypothetical protein
MINYREILRLKNLGINNSQIAESMPVSRPTVKDFKVLFPSFLLYLARGFSQIFLRSLFFIFL